MIRTTVHKAGFVGLLACVALAWVSLWTTEAMEAKAPASPLLHQPSGDSLDAFQDRMVEVGTWVFDYDGRRGEVDRGNVTWTFANDGTMTVTDSDETYTMTYSLTEYCGEYSKISEQDVAYLKVESDGSLEECYIILDMSDVGPPEDKVLALMNSNADSLFLIPAD